MTRSLHILALLSAPLVDASGNPVPQLDLEREARRVRDQLAAIERAVTLQLCIATPDNLLAALRDGPPDVLFFSGHGNMNELVFEDGRGGTYQLDAPRLQALFAPLDGPPCRVAFLSACHSASLAGALLAVGVPHVVAVDAAQPILELAAQAFARHFFPFLAAGHSVRRAFEAGRAAVFTDPETRRALEDWLAARYPWVAALRGKYSDLAAILQQLEALKFILLPERKAGAPDDLHAAVPFPEVPRGRLEVRDLPEPPAALGVTPEFFLGRERDLYEVLQRVLDHRLTTLRGGGGVGKSELAREIGRWCARRGLFPGGIFFVSLGGLGATITPADARVAIAAAAAPGRDLASITTDDRALAAALPPQSLLILDELDVLCFAHLRATRALLEALAGGGRAHVLATSRQASGAAGEQCYELRRLRPPADRSLFLQLAQACVGALCGSEAELREVLEFLDGVPRAIHLAAKQLDTPELGVLLQELRQARETILHDPAIPPEERTDHESVLVTLESSFQRLRRRDPKAADFFPCLALFPAGIPARGLEDIFGLEAVHWARIVHDLSLVELEPPLDAYYLPTPTRHYAERQLSPRRAGIMSTYGADALRYFAKVSEDLDDLITGGQPERGIALITHELPNLHLWLDWGFAAEKGQGDGACQTAQIMATLINFYQLVGALHEDVVTRYHRACECATRLRDRRGEAHAR
ncbi:MAG: CHAT domain-containing protein, partial [Anaerolineae bacterium]